MQSEIWLPIAGFVGLYEVSSMGRMRSLDRRSWNGVAWHQAKGRIISSFLAGKGYEAVSLWKENRSQKRYIHELMLTTFVGPCPDGMECRHLDGDKNHNYLENLRWGMPRENSADQLIHGTRNRGEQQHCAKLSELSARKAKQWLSEGMSSADIGRRLGVHRKTISDIKLGHSWAWLA